MSQERKRGNRRGILFVVSAPSGGGKTTLVKAALESDPALTLSVSLTTRQPRVGEVDGKDYFFVSAEEFAQRRDAGEFAESAEVFDHAYATPRRPLEEAIDQGRDVLLDVDIQGARALKKLYGPDAVGIFVMPPSFAALERRLRERGTDSDDQIARRLQRVRTEMRAAAETEVYDYRIINEDRAVAASEIRAILSAERLRLTRVPEPVLD